MKEEFLQAADTIAPDDGMDMFDDDEEPAPAAAAPESAMQASLPTTDAVQSHPEPLSSTRLPAASAEVLLCLCLITVDASYAQQLV